MATNETGRVFIRRPVFRLIMTEFTFGEAERHLARRVSERVANTSMSRDEGDVLLETGLEVTRGRTTLVPLSEYAEYETEARDRIPDDPDDWHTVALALKRGIDIWTNDRHFFGCGVPVWSTETLRRRLAAGRI